MTAVFIQGEVWSVFWAEKNKYVVILLLTLTAAYDVPTSKHRQLSFKKSVIAEAV